LRALAFLRLVIASPEFASDTLLTVLSSVVYSCFVRLAHANQAARMSLVDDEADFELDRQELLKLRSQLLPTPPGPLWDSLEDLVSGLAAVIRLEPSLAQQFWAEKR